MTGTENKVGLGSALRRDMTDAGRDMWFAGLGAVALIEKQGRRALETLVEEGRAFQARERPRRDRMWQETAGRVRALGQRMENGLQETSRTVLQRFGIPSRDEIATLGRRVELLTASLEKLDPKAGPVGKTPAVPEPPAPGD
jgi:poly(hydroxyalkanoate) granule-associated protein